jgi:hypothetical protein
LQLDQNRAVRFVLHCNQGANIITMHARLCWLRVDERLTASLLVFIRNMNILEIPNCLHNQLTHSTDTNTYPTRHATRDPFTVPRSRTYSRKHIVLYRAINAWNYLPSHIVNSKSGLKHKYSNTSQHNAGSSIM